MNIFHNDNTHTRNAAKNISTWDRNKVNIIKLEMKHNKNRMRFNVATVYGYDSSRSSASNFKWISLINMHSHLYNTSAKALKPLLLLLFRVLYERIRIYMQWMSATDPYDSNRQKISMAIQHIFSPAATLLRSIHVLQPLAIWFIRHSYVSMALVLDLHGISMRSTCYTIWNDLTQRIDIRDL